MKLACRILGHEWQDDKCRRCGYAMPENAIVYEHGDWLDLTASVFAQAAWAIKTLFAPESCPDCGRLRWWAGCEVGDHDRCHLPF